MSLTYIPQGGALVETCTRTVQGRLLLRPGPEANDLILGCLGRAVDYAGITLCGFSFLSGHQHCLYWTENALCMARFQNHLNSNIARELGRLHDWPEKFWGRRYRAMIVSDEKEAQLARLKYVLANGVKEGLVASPMLWPGANAARALVHGEALTGYWYHRAKEWQARRRGESFEKHDYATRYEVELQPLPSYQDLTPEAYRQLIADLIGEIETEALERRRGRPFFGAQAILEQHPHRRPSTIKKSPAPMLFFADDFEKRNRMKDDYDAFEAEYRQAAKDLCRRAKLNGRRNPAHLFPTGCFPRAMPFVGAELGMPLPPPTRRIEVVRIDGERQVIRHEVPTVRVPRASCPRPPAMGVLPALPTAA
jgi:hypothetical protein